MKDFIPMPQEIAEYEEEERKWKEELYKQIDQKIEDWSRSELKRLGYDKIDRTQSSTSVETT